MAPRNGLLASTALLSLLHGAFAFREVCPELAAGAATAFLGKKGFNPDGPKQLFINDKSAQTVNAYGFIDVSCSVGSTSYMNLLGDTCSSFLNPEGPTLGSASLTYLRPSYADLAGLRTMYYK